MSFHYRVIGILLLVGLVLLLQPYGRVQPEADAGKTGANDVMPTYWRVAA